MSFIQQTMFGLCLYMFIGMLIGIQFILRYSDKNDPENPEQWAAFLYRMVLLWPTHIFIMLGISIIRFSRKKTKDDD